MSDAPNEAPIDPAERGPREAPFTTKAVYGALVALLAFSCVACLVFSVAYGYFLEVRSLR